MIQNLTLAHPYAKALFELALEKQALDDWTVVLKYLKQAMKQTKLKQLTDDPRLNAKKVIECLQDLVKDSNQTLYQRLQTPLNHFLQLLQKMKRLTLLPSIANQYFQLLATYQGTTPIKVTSANKMTKAQRQKMQQKLEQRFKTKAKIVFSKDETLLLGAVVKVGSFMIDGSVKGKIAKLKEGLSI